MLKKVYNLGKRSKSRNIGLNSLLRGDPCAALGRMKMSLRLPVLMTTSPILRKFERFLIKPKSLFVNVFIKMIYMFTNITCARIPPPQRPAANKRIAGLPPHCPARTPREPAARTPLPRQATVLVRTTYAYALL